MRHHIPFLLLGASLLLACKKEEPPPPPPEDPTLARIKVGAAGVALGPETVVAGLEDKDSMLHPLIDKLDAVRKKFEKEHPSQTFVRRVEIDVEAGTSCRAVMNVVNAALIAKTWSFKLRSGTDEVEIPAVQLPRPDPPKDARPLYINPHPDGSADIFLTPCLAPYETTQASGIPSVVKEICGEAGECIHELGVACDEKVPFEKVLPAFAALRGSSKKWKLATTRYCDSTIDLSEGPNDKGPDTKITVRELYRGFQMRPPNPKAGYKIKVLAVEGIDASRLPAYTEKIEGHKPAFASCYEPGLRDNRNLQGRVAVRVDMNKQGGVVQVKNDAKTDIPDRFVAACVMTSLTNVTFPPSESRTSLLVSLGFAPPW